MDAARVAEPDVARPPRDDRDLPGALGVVLGDRVHLALEHGSRGF